jgi:hypothetical protein
MLYSIPATAPIRPANTPPLRMPNPFLSPPFEIGAGVGVGTPVVDDVPTSSPVVAVCVPEAKLTGQVLGVGHSVHVQLSGYIESVRDTVEVTVTVVMGAVQDVGGGGGMLVVEFE